MSVFAGGCTLEAAEEVCDADLDTLQSLVEQSLLRFTDDRYWMLETIRAYARTRLEASGQLRSIQERHAASFAVLAAKGTAEMPELRREWADRFENERENLRAAMAWCLHEGPSDRTYQLAIAYGLLCADHGPLSEGRSWLDAALQQTEEVPSALRARALIRASSLAERQQDIATGRAFAQDGLDLARATDDVDAIGRALVALGVIEGDEGKVPKSEALLNEALDLFSMQGQDQMSERRLARFDFSTSPMATMRGPGSCARKRSICPARRVTRGGLPLLPPTWAMPSPERE